MSILSIRNEILKGANDKQKQLIQFKDGYCISSSTSGAGKTFSLVKRVEYLVKVHGVPQEDIVVMTFTKSGVETFSKRLRKIGLRNVRVGTIHSIANEIYTQEYGRNNKLVPVWELERLFNEIYKEKHNGDNNSFDFNTINLAIGLQEAHMKKWNAKQYVPYDTTYMELSEEDLKDYYHAYVQYKKENGYISFNDMVTEAISVLKKRPTSPYKYGLLDEAQDTSKLAFAFMDLLAPHNQMIVGHASQSIYGFSGADLNSFINYNKTHTPCEIINLNTNYRSKKTIVDNYNKFESYWYGRLDIYEKAIANDQSAGIVKTIEVPDMTQEAYETVKIIKDCINRGINYEDIKVLYRNNSQCSMLEVMLKQEGIPYEIVNKDSSIFNLKEIQCALNILRLIRDEEDSLAMEKLFGCRQGTLQFVSDDIIKKIISFAHNNNCTTIEAIPMIHYTNSKTRTNVHTFLRKFEQIRENYCDHEDVLETLQEIYKAMGIKQRVEKEENEKDLVVQKAYQTLFAMCKGKDITQVIDMLSTGGDTKTKAKGFRKKSTDKVMLETLHQSKGQESRVVIMIGINNNLFKYDSKKKDRTEINCFFVGISRPQEELYVITDYDNEFAKIMNSGKRKRF